MSALSASLNVPWWLCPRNDTHSGGSTNSLGDTEGTGVTTKEGETGSPIERKLSRGMIPMVVAAGDNERNHIRRGVAPSRRAQGQG